jgi:hypothetical protein
VRRSEYLAGLAIGVLFLVPLLMYGPFEEEETELGIFASQVHYQALLHGRWLFWLNDLGFGTPLPIGSRLDFHPIFALAGIAPLRVALSALWLVQIAAMVIYFLRLAALTGIRASLRLFLLVCYVFSVATVCYFYENDWVTHVVGWTFYPVLVFYLREAVTGAAITHFARTAIRLGLLFGLWVVNSHFGYIVPVAIPLIVYALAAAVPHRRVYACLFVAFLLCVAISAERVYFYASEAGVFPTSLARANAPGIRLADYATAAVSPLAGVDSMMRQPFVGLVFLIAALVSLFSVSRIRDRHVRACSVAFLASLLLGLVPARVFLALLWNAPAGTWNLRDSALFFGLFAAGLVLQRGLESSRRLVQASTGILLALQLVQQGVTVWPGFREFVDHRGMLEFYRHQAHPVGLARVLSDTAAQFGPRLYVSEPVERLMRGPLSPYGVHFGTDLVFLGLNPVNAWFKSISMDRLYPSWALMQGQIRGEPDVIENRTLLDVLGINMVLMSEPEDPATTGLVPVQRMHVDTYREKQDLVVLGNPDAWPKAVLMRGGVRGVVLRRRPRCSNDAALCRDYTPFVEQRLPGNVDVTARDGRYAARFASADDERVLFLSTTYRPEWQARSSSGRLDIVPIAGAFVGVIVPPRVTDVDIAFVPRARIALTWFSSATLLLLVATLVLTTRRSRRTARPITSGDVDAGRSARRAAL